MRLPVRFQRAAPAAAPASAAPMQPQRALAGAAARLWQAVASAVAWGRERLLPHAAAQGGGGAAAPAAAPPPARAAAVFGGAGARRARRGGGDGGGGNGGGSGAGFDVGAYAEEIRGRWSVSGSVRDFAPRPARVTSRPLQGGYGLKVVGGGSLEGTGVEGAAFGPMEAPGNALFRLSRPRGPPAPQASHPRSTHTQEESLPDELRRELAALEKFSTAAFAPGRRTPAMRTETYRGHARHLR
jgi:hypothetical protein